MRLRLEIEPTETGIKTFLLDPTADEQKLDFGPLQLTQLEMFYMLQRMNMTQEEAVLYMETKMALRKGMFR